MKLLNVNILIFLLLLTSCDIFETREPEEPESGRSATLPATTPSQLFENLKLALKDKAVDNYMRLFVDEFLMNAEFSFVPSSGAASKYPSLLQWDLNSERLYFNNVKVATPEGGSMILTQSEINNITTVDSAVFQFDYTLIVPFSESELENTFRGRAEYTIKLNTNNEWVITRWEDIEVENFSSWSELKGLFN
jgi:hypothetical protein